MLKLNPDSKRIPYGGHHYPEYGETFRGESFKEVVQKVADFRLHNNIPAGDPEQDVLEFYVRYWPWLTKETTAEPDPVDTNYSLWREWIYKTWKNPPLKYVSMPVAKDRWAICETCPFNQPKDWGTSKESEELTRRAFLLKRGIDTPSSLGFCSCHNADLPALSFLEPAKNFSAKKEAEQPSFCWVK